MARPDAVARLREQGVAISNPESIEIGAEVPLQHISGPETVIYPGVRLAGEHLHIEPGCTLGAEGPATVDNCALARGVELKAGYFAGSVFLGGASMGLGAHVRGGTLLEEQANGAHTVGLKQTILLPFVTLGSLINFCDVLMAGGTSRRDHSEVGSSFIHFNFTPHGERGDKATPSLIGDVPNGVMLRSSRIFLGGQAGLVGPVHVDYGTVLAAGGIYRRDHGPDELVLGEPFKPAVLRFSPSRYHRVRAKVEKNLRYIGNVAALWHWYRDARVPLASGDLGLREVYAAAQRVLENNVEERIRQLGRVAGYMEQSIKELEQQGGASSEIATQRQFSQRWSQMEAALAAWQEEIPAAHNDRDRLVRDLQAGGSDYLGAVKSLGDEAVAAGCRWLSRIVARATERVHLLDA